MIKTIDEIMYISDGINPFGYGLGFIPTLYNIKGNGIEDKKPTMNDVYLNKYKKPIMNDVYLNIIKKKYFESDINEDEEYNEENPTTDDLFKKPTMNDVYKINFKDKKPNLNEYLEKEEDKVNNEDEEYIEENYNNDDEYEILKQKKDRKNVFYYNLKPKILYEQNTNVHNFLPIKNFEGWGINSSFYNMVGGMAKQHIDTGKLDHELFEKYGVDNMNDLIDYVMHSELRDEEKYNFLLKEGTDIMVDLKKKAQISNNDELEKEVIDTTDKIVGLLNDFKNKGYQITDEQKELLKALKNDAINDEINPHYDLSFSTAKQTKNTFKEQSEERGNIVEDDLTKNKTILEIIDDDNSTPYNTKDLNAYNLDFINALIKMELGNPDFKNLTNVNLIPPQLEKILYDKFLQFVPVDIVKDNTIWEIKSFNKSVLPNNEKQKMSETKLKGFENKFWVDLNQRLGKGYSIKSTPYSYDFRYKNIGNDKKVDNIYFKFQTPISYFGKPTGKKFDFNIPIFKTNPKGFNYYWLYDNIDKIGYINPLKKDNFTNYDNQLNNPNTRINSKGKKIIEVDNDDIRIMPYSYAKTIKDFKSKNKPLDNIKKLEKNLFKKTLKVQKK